jgi:hypothetical protein
MDIFLCVPMLAHLMVLVSNIEKTSDRSDPSLQETPQAKQSKASAPQAKQLFAHK